MFIFPEPPKYIETEPFKTYYNFCEANPQHWYLFILWRLDEYNRYYGIDFEQKLKDLIEAAK